MGTYRNISLTFWTDPKIDDDFTPHEKYLYLYFLTNPHTNICGCYQIAQKQMTRETGLEWEEVSRLISRMQEEHGVLRYCPETKEILILHWGRYNWPRSEKVMTAIRSVAAHIRCREFQTFVLDAVSARWDKKESTKEKTEHIAHNPESQNTEHRAQKPEPRIQNGTIGYGYPMDTQSAEGGDGDSMRQEAAFLRFWEAYPRKIRQAEARAAFQEIQVELSVLLSAIEAQKNGPEWQNEHGRFIPSPAKWLKGQRWTDTVTPAAPAARPQPQQEVYTPGKAELSAISRMKQEIERMKGDPT